MKSVLNVTIKLDLTTELNPNATTNVYDTNNELLYEAETTDDIESMLEEAIGECLEDKGFLPHNIDCDWKPYSPEVITDSDLNDIVSVSGKIRCNLKIAMDLVDNANEAIEGKSFSSAANLLDRVEIYTSAINSLIAKEL